MVTSLFSFFLLLLLLLLFLMDTHTTNVFIVHSHRSLSQSGLDEAATPSFGSFALSRTTKPQNQIFFFFFLFLYFWSVSWTFFIDMCKELQTKYIHCKTINTQSKIIYLCKKWWKCLLWRVDVGLTHTWGREVRCTLSLDQCIDDLTIIIFACVWCFTDFRNYLSRFFVSLPCRLADLRRRDARFLVFRRRKTSLICRRLLPPFRQP